MAMLNTNSKSEIVFRAIVEILTPELSRPEFKGGINVRPNSPHGGSIDSTQLLDIILEVEQRCACLEFDRRVSISRKLYAWQSGQRFHNAVSGCSVCHDRHPAGSQPTIARFGHASAKIAKREDRMSITIIPLSEADHAGVLQLLATFWQRGWTETLIEDYFVWRYGSRGDGETLVACDRGRSVGIFRSFIRRYWIDGRQELVRETGLVLPAAIPGAWRRIAPHAPNDVQAGTDPLLGGSQTTLDLMPRLKWARLPNAERFLLSVSARNAAGRIGHRLGRCGVALARMIPDARLVRRLRREPLPSATAQVRRREFGAAIEEIAEIVPYDFAPWLDTATLDWLASAPKVLGEFVLLSFFSDCKLVGVSVSRLQQLAFGSEAHMVHVHAERLVLVDWIVSETVHHLIDRGAGAVACETSCPATGRALDALGFVRRRAIQAHWWHANKRPPSGVLNLTTLRADDALGFA